MLGDAVFFSSRRCLIFSVRHSSSLTSWKYGSVSISDGWTLHMSDLSHFSMIILRFLTVVDLASCSISDKIVVKNCFLDFFSFNHTYEPSSKSLSLMLSFWEWLYQSHMCTKREVHHNCDASAAAWLQLHSFSSVNTIQDATIPARIMHLVYRHLGSWWGEMKFLIKLHIPRDKSSLLDIHVVF